MASARLRTLQRISLSAVLVGALIVHDSASARGPAGGGPSGHAPASAAASAYGTVYRAPVVVETEGTDAPVKEATRAAETSITVCSEQDPHCIADALDAYAEALRKIPLPPELQGLPDVVSRAAHRVRAAKTKAQAVAAIKVAIAEVHRTISLLKADDPIVLKAETREGAFVAETLEAANDKLEKAAGL